MAVSVGRQIFDLLNSGAVGRQGHCCYCYYLQGSVVAWTTDYVATVVNTWYDTTCTAVCQICCCSTFLLNLKYSLDKSIEHANVVSTHNSGRLKSLLLCRSIMYARTYVPYSSHGDIGHTTTT